MQNILLVIGAGGAFNKVLLDSGIGTTIAEIAKESHISPILLGWGIATIRIATGSDCFHDNSSRNSGTDCKQVHQE